MGLYTADSVAELLEHRCEDTDNLTLIDAYADIDTALLWLQTEYPGCHILAVAFRDGYTTEEIAAYLKGTERDARAALHLIFESMACYLNGDDDDGGGED